MSIESSDSIAEGNSLKIDQRFCSSTSDDVLQAAELPVDANYIAMSTALEEVKKSYFSQIFSVLF
jgi:hypothetical protein